MPTEEGVNMVLVVILALLLLVIMIGFYVLFRPGIERGWFSLFVDFLKKLVSPVV